MLSEVIRVSKCMLCPRKCGADRENGELGVCSVSQTLKIARIAPHYWEEPCISGVNGSGAVFFSGCPLRCVYCQNREINSGAVGKEYTVDELAEQLKKLEASGVHNINLVTPTHYTPQIASVLEKARLHIPVVYNCGGYELPQTLALLKGKVQIYLPDFKYSDATLAQRYSFAADYPQVALNAIDCMLEQVGEPVFDGDGLMKSGVIVRHLVLPNHTDESMKAIRMLHERYGNQIYISIMNQYTPMPDVNVDELSRPVTDDEYALVLDYAEHLGVVNGFVQESGTVGESFIPPFSDD